MDPFELELRDISWDARFFATTGKCNLVLVVSISPLVARLSSRLAARRYRVTRARPRTQMEQQLQAIVTVLSLVNPLICGTMFAQMEAGQTRATRLADATKAALAVLVILVIAALVGARVLKVFGVSLQAFSIAGGGVLTWIGFSMLRGSSPQS